MRTVVKVVEQARDSKSCGNGVDLTVREGGERGSSFKQCHLVTTVVRQKMHAFPNYRYRGLALKWELVPSLTKEIQTANSRIKQDVRLFTRSCGLFLRVIHRRCILATSFHFNLFSWSIFVLRCKQVSFDMSKEYPERVHRLPRPTKSCRAAYRIAV